jgi:hypothetical protein
MPAVVTSSFLLDADRPSVPCVSLIFILQLACNQAAIASMPLFENSETTNERCERPSEILKRSETGFVSAGPDWAPGFRRRAGPKRLLSAQPDQLN